MLKPWQYRLLNAIGAVALVLALANGFVFTHNRDAQLEVNSRQQYLQQTASLDGLYRDIVKALAELAVKNNDAQLQQMLAANGINVTLNAPVVAAAPAPAGTPVKR